MSDPTWHYIRDNVSPQPKARVWLATINQGVCSGKWTGTMFLDSRGRQVPVYAWYPCGSWPRPEEPEDKGWVNR